MIEETLEGLISIEMTARGIRRMIFAWAEEDKMTKGEWDRFVQFMVDDAEEHDRDEPVGDRTFYRCGQYVIERGPHRTERVSKCRDATEANDLWNRLVQEAHKEEPA